jgi:hypothetical protein
MKVIDKNLAISFGELSEEIIDVFVCELADEELEIFQIFSDHLDLSDTHWPDFDKLSQGSNWVVGVEYVLLLQHCVLQLCFVHFFIINQSILFTGRFIWFIINWGSEI